MVVKLYWRKWPAGHASDLAGGLQIGVFDRIRPKDGGQARSGLIACRQIEGKAEPRAVVSFVRDDLLGDAVELRSGIGELRECVLVTRAEGTHKIVWRIGGSFRTGDEFRAVRREKRNKGFIGAVRRLENAIGLEGVQGQSAPGTENRPWVKHLSPFKQVEFLFWTITSVPLWRRCITGAPGSL